MIVLFGAMLRLVWTGHGPNGLNRDEAALAYNAYLLAETGKDEWGRAFPVALESFGDFKLIGYPLLLVPVFKVVPLDEFSDFLVRLPSVFAGISLIGLAFAFARRWLFSEKWSLLFSFLIATTPVFIFYSRFAFEANVALTLFVASFLLLANRSSTTARTLIVQMLGLLLYYWSLCTYNTPLLLAPALVELLWSLQTRDKLQFGKKLRYVLLPTLGVIVIAGLFLFQTRTLLEQKKSITIFSDPTIQAEYPDYRNSFAPPWNTVLGNDKVYFALLTSKHALATFSPQFLGLQGGAHPWHSLIGYGHYFFHQYVFVMIGFLFFLFFSIKYLRSDKKQFLLPLLVVLALSLAPAAVTVDAPHATRSLFSFFLLILLGLAGYREYFSQHSIKSIVSRWHIRKALLVALISTQVVFSLLYVYQLRTKHEAQVSGTIFPGLETFLRDNNSVFANTTLTVQDTEGYRYISFAWYGRVPADTFFRTITRLEKNAIGFSYGSVVGPYQFKSTLSPQDNEYIEFVNGNWRHVSP